MNLFRIYFPSWCRDLILAASAASIEVNIIAKQEDKVKKRILIDDWLMSFREQTRDCKSSLIE